METGSIDRSRAGNGTAYVRGSGNDGAGPVRARPDESAAVELLPTPSSSINLDSIMGVILLMERSLTAQRRSADQRREIADKMQEQHEKRAVGKMREEANEAFAGALTSGIIQIAGGALQMVGAGMQAHAAALEANATKAAETASKAANTANEAATQATDASAKALHRAKSLDKVGGLYSKGGEIVSGLSKGADGIYQSEMKETQAEAAEENNAAHAAERLARRSSELADEMRDLAQKTFDRLEQLIQAEQQGRLALIQRA